MEAIACKDCGGLFAGSHIITTDWKESREKYIAEGHHVYKIESEQGVKINGCSCLDHPLKSKVVTIEPYGETLIKTIEEWTEKGYIHTASTRLGDKLYLTFNRQ